MVQKLFNGDAFFGIGRAAYGYSRFSHGFGPAGNQGVPPGEAFSFVQQAVGAGFGKPAKPANIIGGQGHAIGNPGGAVRVIGALAGFEIKQLAGGTGVDEFARILVFQLVQAAAAAAIAQAFPFSPAHLRKGLGFPERGFGRHGSVLILTVTQGQLLTGVILPKSARNLLYKHLSQDVIKSLSVK